GLKVLSITPDENLITIAKQILTLTGTACTESPVLLAANRDRSRAASLTIPGILISQVNEERALLPQMPLHPRLCHFLREKQIQPLQIKRVVK
ncbi:MAG: hypothetical protein PVG85_03730, partial [Deltaproteobacteria bacterium]